MTAELSEETHAFVRPALRLMTRACVPFLLGGARALAKYTGIDGLAADLDLFVRPGDADRALAAFADAGYRTEQAFPHGPARASWNDAFVNLSDGSGLGPAEVDDGWFLHAVEGEVMGVRVRLCPPEELLASKAFVQERERYDGADVAHLILARGDRLDWDRVLRRFGPNWRVLLSHLVLFGYVYPGEREKVPGAVLRDLLGRLLLESVEPAPAPETDAARLCRGTFLSNEQYLIDLNRWGYADARGSVREPGDLRRIWAPPPVRQPLSCSR